MLHNRLKSVIDWLYSNRIKLKPLERLEIYQELSQFN